MTRIKASRDPEHEQFAHTAARSALIKASDAEIDRYIDNNINSLAEAKAYLKQITKITRDTARYVRRIRRQ
ncbi:MAG: hypothetical protein CME59_22660 [Halioglobus sp.]|nr:hypothetical protein [Halioglobus sp.]|tara:strand:- start:1434 stop:1646 length:213 start_codon:yes stop_codon:yes gene_type:complete